MDEIRTQINRPFPAPLTELDRRCINRIRRNDYRDYKKVYYRLCKLVLLLFSRELHGLNPELTEENNRKARALTKKYFADFVNEARYEYVDCTLSHYFYLDIMRRMEDLIKDINN